ncbi:MAG: MAPEG family protein, partial [Alkalimonas sp.]|nr:MAPEG family protein [Alkalimonas sp.]
HNPREQQAALHGFGQRANAAHYNSFEALIIFACAVLAVAISGTVDGMTEILAWLFVLSRLGYLLCYWFDWASLRSMVWMVGMVSALTMVGRAIWGG